MSQEELVNKLAAMLQQQHDKLDEERKDSIRREEKMQSLLEAALQKMPDEHQQGKKIPTNATPAPMLLHNASLREFTTWNQKFTDYMLLTGINNATNDRQKAVLRSLLDDEWFRIAKFALNIKMEDGNTTVETIITQMLDYLRSQRNVVLDRKEFYLRNQQPDEKFDDYYISLQEIAAFCDFCPNCINQQYRDRIVTGIQHEETVKDLLSEKDLTLAKAVSICRANENATNDTENLQATATGINRIAKYKKSNTQYQKSENENRYYKVQPWRKKANDDRFNRSQPNEQRDSGAGYNRNQSWDSRKSPNTQWNGEQRPCTKCGRKWHGHISLCPARDQNCAKCGKLGHFARVCLIVFSDEEEDEDYRDCDGDNAWRITVAGVNDNSYRRKTPKVVITATYAGKETQLVTTPDTGAEMSVIGMVEAKKLGANVDNLTPSKHRLYAADRKKLTCLGVVKVDLKLGDKATEVSLVVVLEVQGFLLSWYHAKDLGILPECFPNQISSVNNHRGDAEHPQKPPICSEKCPSTKVREEHAEQ